MKNNNPAAYPLEWSSFEGYDSVIRTYHHQPGMTLRDYFAGQVILSLANAPLNPDSLAREAYEIADAMIEERLKVKESVEK